MDRAEIDRNVVLDLLTAMGEELAETAGAWVAVVSDDSEPKLLAYRQAKDTFMECLGDFLTEMGEARCYQRYAILQGLFAPLSRDQEASEN